MSSDEHDFLRRWSRLKRQRPAASVAPAELPALEALTFESDFGAFMRAKVDEGVKRAALKKLFSDPHFNIMDGLDVYIEDYSKPSPLPAQMLATLRQAQQILDWAKEQRADQEQGPQSSASAAQPALLGEAHTFVTPPSGLATGGGEEAAAEPSTFTERKA